MAAEDYNTFDLEKQDLDEYDDTVICCICTNVYTDPKALPCIHTFCMKCLQQTGLQSNKGPGDEMPCPLCRQQFKIPQEGFFGLPNNFFTEKLIQLLTNVTSPSVSARGLCDVCVDDNEEMRKDMPKADMYCSDCKQNLCKECCKYHRILKLTKHHKFVPLGLNEQRVSVDNVMESLAPSVCELHEQKILDIYCAECKTVQCAVCFIDGHKHHEGSHVTKFVDDFRKQIEKNIETINQCSSQTQLKKSELLKIKEDMRLEASRVEFDVLNRREEIKQFAVVQSVSLLQNLYSVRDSKLKEIQLETGDIDAHLSCLQSYSSFYQKVKAKGSASDICRAVSESSVKALELKQQGQSLIEREVQCPLSCFITLDLKEFLQNDDNTTGDCKAKILDLERTLEQERNTWIAEKEQLTRQIEEQRRLIVELRYKMEPVLVQTIRPKVADEEKKSIRGLTILDKELFVVSGDSSEVEVYDSITLSFSSRWNLNELMDPVDIGSCNRIKCLYIWDYRGERQTELLRVDPYGKLIRNWSTAGDWEFGLSVTSESNVILTEYHEAMIYEYSPDGQLIRRIELFSNLSIRSLWHAVKLPSGHYVISHGHGDDNLHRVCALDADGNLKKSFGGKRGSTIGQMNGPIYLSVDGNGFVMVVDHLNSRVLLLDSDLKFKREILSKEKHELRRPMRIRLDETNGRLFVVDNEEHFQKKSGGRILIFDFK